MQLAGVACEVNDVAFVVNLSKKGGGGHKEGQRSKPARTHATDRETETETETETMTETE